MVPKAPAKIGASSNLKEKLGLKHHKNKTNQRSNRIMISVTTTKLQLLRLVLVMIMTFQKVQSAAAAKGIETSASNHTRNSFDSHLRRSLKKDKANGDDEVCYFVEENSSLTNSDGELVGCFRVDKVDKCGEDFRFLPHNGVDECDPEKEVEVKWNAQAIQGIRFLTESVLVCLLNRF